MYVGESNCWSPQLSCRFFDKLKSAVVFHNLVAVASNLCKYYPFASEVMETAFANFLSQSLDKNTVASPAKENLLKTTES